MGNNVQSVTLFFIVKEIKGFLKKNYKSSKISKNI